VLVFGWVRTRICSVFVLAALVQEARATPYETFIDIDDESDLQDLLAAGTITEDSYNELLDLLSRGVDLARADRNDLYALPNLTYEDVDAIVAYRSLQKGRISDPAELVASGALSEEKLLAISSFLIVRQKGENTLAAHGWVRLMTRASRDDFNPFAEHDTLIPPFGLRARVTAARHLTAGIALTTTRLEIGDPIYDQSRDALVADAASNQLHVPKAYVKWETNTFEAIAGSFRAGFGQRLVFDNSSTYAPNGLYIDDQLFFSTDLSAACKVSAGELFSSPCTGAAGAEYVTPDFAWRDGLFGIAAGFKKLELSTGWLQGYLFASASRRGIYQYELVDAGKCADPRDDKDPACGAPVVYVAQENLLDPSPRHAFATLPNVFQERLLGGNFTYFADRRNSVGLTAYGATEENLIGGIDLDLQEWSRLPGGGTFGAAGANVSFGRDRIDVFAEGAASFDSMKVEETALTPARGGGGPAGIVRVTITPSKKEELEIVGRYYSVDFVNPYARPISESDEFEGQRARDEAGGRIRYVRSAKELVIRALADVWVNPSSSSDAKLDTYIRANVKTTPELWLGLWERYQDKNINKGSLLGSPNAMTNSECFELSNELDETGETIPCAGRQLSTTVRAVYEPNRQISATLQLDHQLLDDNTRPNLQNKFRQDIAAWFVAYYRPTRDIRLRYRIRFLDEAINDNTYLERSISTVFDAAFRVRERDTLRLRLDGKTWMDKRMSTVERRPNPELSLWVFYEAKL
jgi:hypothetical protein